MVNDVQFDIERNPRPVYQRGGSRLSRWVVQYSGGLIKNETQANYVLVVFVIISLVLSISLVVDSAVAPVQKEIKIMPAII